MDEMDRGRSRTGVRPPQGAAATRCPGKIIISGEHAVVYGWPALALAVDRYVETTCRPGPPGRFVFALPSAGRRLEYAAAELADLHARLSQRHAAFARGDLTIAEVMPDPFELVPFAFAHPFVTCGLPWPAGATVEVALGVPLGCGMGASAAVSLALLLAPTALAPDGPAPDRVTLYEWALTCERLRHGRPSGVDPYVCLHGGLVRFVGGQATPLPLPPWSLQLVHTGVPAASTGECVMQVAAGFPASHRIWDDFGAVTAAVAAAWAPGDAPALREAIRANHRLLCQIGVTPAPVAAFITELEGAGAAAKVCGAGSVRGPGGGLVLVLSDEPVTAACRRHGYTLMTVQGDADGARVL